MAGGEKWEVAYVAKKLGVTVNEVKAAVKKVGPGRLRVEEEIKNKRK